MGIWISFNSQNTVSKFQIYTKGMCKHTKIRRPNATQQYHRHHLERRTSNTRSNKQPDFSHAARGRNWQKSSLTLETTNVKKLLPDLFCPASYRCITNQPICKDTYPALPPSWQCSSRKLQITVQVVTNRPISRLKNTPRLSRMCRCAC